MTKHSPIRPVHTILGASSSSAGLQTGCRPGVHARTCHERVQILNSLDKRKVIRASEAGYTLLIAMFLMTLLVISLGIAAPQIAKSIQRDRDLEAFHRGMQYRRAIQLYYRKFHAYPPNLDALVKTNDIRFLRKKYEDPITGKADWKPVLFGQNKTPTAMGFFGQALGGGATSIAGIGPGGGPGSTPGTLTVFPDNSGTYVPGATGTNPQGPAGTTSTSATAGTSPTVGPGSSTSSTNSPDQSGQTFGGAGIIGFSPAPSKKSILVYKKKDHYNEWEFTYDPISEMQSVMGGNPAGVGQPNPSPNPTPSPNQSSQQ